MQIDCGFLSVSKLNCGVETHQLEPGRNLGMPCVMF